MCSFNNVIIPVNDSKLRTCVRICNFVFISWDCIYGLASSEKGQTGKNASYNNSANRFVR